MKIWFMLLFLHLRVRNILNSRMKPSNHRVHCYTRLTKADEALDKSSLLTLPTFSQGARRNSSLLVIIYWDTLIIYSMLFNVRQEGPLLHFHVAASMVSLQIIMVYAHWLIISYLSSALHTLSSTRSRPDDIVYSEKELRLRLESVHIGLSCGYLLLRPRWPMTQQPSWACNSQ